MTLEIINTDLWIQENDANPIILCDTNNLYIKFNIENDDNDSIILKFKNYVIYKFGYPGHESIQYHEYSNYNISTSTFYKVENSLWISELKNIANKHPYYNKERWNSYNHFIITFEDQIFECISDQYEITNEVNFDNIIFRNSREDDLNFLL